MIHVLHYDPKTGDRDEGRGDRRCPRRADAPAPTRTSRPSADHRLSWPRDIAVSPNGRTLLVSLNLADTAAVIDTATGNVRYVSVGHYPYGAGITSDGRYGLVSSETEGTVSVIDLAAAKVVKNLQVAPPLSHPESIAIDPKAPLAFVGNANQDTITVINTKSFSVTRTLSVERPQGVGTSPTYVSVTSDGCDLLSADSGEDAVAVFALSKRSAAARRASPRARRRGRRKRETTAAGRRQAQREGQEEVGRPQDQAVPARRTDPDRELPDDGGRYARSAASSSGSPPGVSASVPTRAVPTRTPATTPTSTSTCRRSSTAPPGC